MLKKTMAVFLAACLILSSMVVYADGTTTTPTTTTTTATDQKDTAKAAAKAAAKASLTAAKQGFAELKPITDSIKANTAEIKTLRENADAALKAAKAHLKELRAKKDSLTPEQIELVKQGLNTVLTDKVLIAQTAGKIAEQSLALRSAKKSKDLEAYKAALNNILSIQATKKANLVKFAADMGSIASI